MSDNCEIWIMTLRSSDLQSDSDLDSIRNSCDEKWNTLHPVWIDLSRREDLFFDSSSDQTKVTNPIQENLSTLFFSQELNWCDPGLRGWPAMKKAHKVFLSRAFSVSLRDQIIFSPLTSVEHEHSTYEHHKNMLKHVIEYCIIKWRTP